MALKGGLFVDYSGLWIFMIISSTNLTGVLLIEAIRHGDERGFFSETYRKAALAEAGFEREFVQDNQSFSASRHTLRGLHYQLAPHGQDKLVRATRGVILDVAVDVRAGSATFGQHVAVELSAQNCKQLLVPRGFAHGFQTLTADCEVIYKVTDYYAPQAERGLLWSDPALGIEWEGNTGTIVNARDAAWPVLSKLDPVEDF